MNVVDSSGWIEYFVDGRKAERFSKPIEQTGKLVVPTIVIFEVFKYLCRESDETQALKAVAAMHAGQLVDLDVDIALRAARMSLDRNLPMADSMILATARAFGAKLWTMDLDFNGIDGVEVA